MCRRIIACLLLFISFAITTANANENPFWCAVDLDNSGAFDQINETSACDIGTEGDTICPYGVRDCDPFKVCKSNRSNQCNALEQCIKPTACQLQTTKTVYECSDTQSTDVYEDQNTCTNECNSFCTTKIVPREPAFYCDNTEEHYANQSDCKLACGEAEYCEDEYVCPYGSSNECKFNSTGTPQCSLLPCIDRGDPTESIRIELETEVPTDTGRYDEIGVCIDELKIFEGKESVCKLDGVQTAYQNCCKKTGDKIYTESQGSVEDSAKDALSTATMQGLYNGVKAAYTAYQATNSYSAASSAMQSAFSGAFDPYSLAISIIINLVIDYLQKLCDEESQFTALSSQSGTCHYLGRVCTEKWIFFGCVQKAQVHCCFNSKIGRIVQEQGRLQLGKSWGTPKNPQCEGFTPAEFQSLDFSRIDLSEYYGDLVPKQLNDIADDARAIINNTVQP